jgi:peptidyl-prolyl cis-trans isomerase D
MITRSPIFQKDGRFVGSDVYRRYLQMMQMSATEFEEEQREAIAADKLRSAVSALAQVDDADVEKRFRDQTERVDVDYLLLADSTYADARPATEAETRAYFASHASTYMTPEARRASYVLFDRESKAATVQVADADLRAYYDKNKSTLYTHPDQRRASHILFRIPKDATPESEAEIRKKAEAVLQKIQGGADFAETARANSEDTGSATSGGDLGFFSKGRMVKEFEEAAFGLGVGQVSGVVKSPFGLHIIKVTEARPAGSQPFEEVRDEIRRTLGVQKAQDEVRKSAEEFSKRLGSQEASFDKIAADMGLKVQDTGFFAKGEPAGPLGRLPQADDAVFGLNPGGVSGPVPVPQGTAVFALAEVRAPQPAPFDSVKSRVESDVKKSRAREKEKTIAAEILAGSGDLKARAEKRKLEVKSFPQVSRMQPLPPLTDASKAAAFAATPGQVLGPFDSEDGLLLVQPTKKTPATSEEEATLRAQLRTQMLDESRSTLFQSMLVHLQKSSAIEVNEGLLRARQ